MDFCRTPLWDTDLTWNTESPDFTPCFHKTVLVYAPALFILLFSPLELYFQRRSQCRNIPWGLVNIARLSGIFVLIVLSAVEFGLTFTSTNKLFVSDILAPIVKLFTLTFVLVLSIGNIRNGIQSSGILFCFWALVTAAEGITFASTVRFGDGQGQVINASLFAIQYGLIASIYFLHFWADPTPQEKSLTYQVDDLNPEVSASFPSKMTFNYMNSMLATGWKRPLTKQDLYDNRPDEQAGVIFSEWNRHWMKQEEAKKRKRSKSPISIFWPLLYTFGFSLLSSSFIQLLTVLITQISPQALNLLIGFVSSDEAQWKGYLYMIFLVGINLIKTILNSQYFMTQQLIGLRIRAAMTSALFRKSLRLSSKSRKERSVGETVNLMQIDTQRLMDIIQSLNLLWSSPITIFLSIYSLWGLLGPSCLAGLLVMVLLIPANALMGTKMRAYQRQNMKLKDTRMKAMNEILDGMKVLKLYAWEPSFQLQVEEIRRTEIDNLKKLSYLQAVQTFLFNAAPFFVAIASFATFVLIDPANVLDAQIAFVSLSYFNIMRQPLNQLPQLVVSMIQAQVSWERLNNYFNAAEVNQNNVTHDDEGDIAVTMEHGSFTWDKELPPSLSNINLEVGRGELVAVVGQVGSGKSSLLSALTNDLEKVSLRARANVCGSVSYVPQQAWMQNATLQYNITFGRKYNEKMYSRVLDACALRPDLEILPNGDSTEIGEKGINLSGGQKQRVSLARAVYNNGDVYLLDDPLSAVDAHVGKHLFEQVIGPTGLLKNKTRILVTHAVKYLPMVDRIVVLKDGLISEIGNYKELLRDGKDFADFLIEYIQDEEGKTLEGEDLEALRAVKGDLENVMGSEKLGAELKKERSVKSAISNISGYRSDGSEFTRVSKMSKLASKTVTDQQNPNNKSLVDEKTPLRGGGRGGRGRGGEGRGRGGRGGSGGGNTGGEKNYGSNNQDSKKEFSGRKGGRGAGRLIQDEKVETRAVEMAVYAFYFKAVGMVAVFSIFLLNVVSQACSIGTNVWLSAWSDDPNSAETATRNMYLSVYGVLGFASATFLGGIALYVAIGGLSASSRLHDKMLKGVLRYSKSPFLIHIINLNLRAPMSFFDTNPKGRIVNRFAKDIDYVDFSIPATFNSLLRQSFTIIGTIGIICVTNPVFIAIIIPIGIGYWLLQKVYVATSRQLRRMESATRSPIYSWFGEAISGIATIKAYGLQQRFVKDIEQKVDANTACMEPNFASNRWLSIRLEMLGNLIIFFASLLCVLGRGTLDPGIVGLSLSYAMQVTMNFNLLIRQTSMIENNMVGVERIMEYQSGLPQEASWELPSDPPAAAWPSEGAISLRQLSTRYREGLDLVLKDINLEVAGGEKVGIVGRTGSGKSSLTLSLFRINEAASGVLAIDGQDVSSLGLGTLRSRLTIIPQDPVLFSGTLRLNLDPFGASSTADLWQALELAHLKSYVASLPGGLEHQITEGGDNLSVGQRQLLCLARACLRHSKVIVLDEATAAIDLETDDLIQATIRKEFHHCTIITIAHRLNTIMDSDRIVVLSDGNLVEADSPAKLLAKRDSAFFSMAKEAGLVQ